MRIIKLSTPWNHDFLKRTPHGEGIFGDYKFVIDDDCFECDYWIVWGGLKQRTRVKCSPENIIYITDEAFTERTFNKDFINQFSAVITCRMDIAHDHIILSHDLGIWHFDRNYEEVNSFNFEKKSKVISAVASDLTWLPGHKKRFAFINKLMGYFQESIDFYGRGINPLKDKLDGIANYRYSIAVENSFLPGYFTEKIFECFLTTTIPIYYGCPDIERYFDERSFIRLNIDDFKSSILTIEDAIKYDIFKERLPFLKESKRIFIEKYLAFPAIIRLIKENLSSNNSPKQSRTILPESDFITPRIQKVYNKIKGLVG